jgi:GNAT superfamily N-acetyltransferase
MVLPHSISFFEPHLRHYAKETLEIGGEVLVSTGSDGAISGLFTYDSYEKTSAIYTRSGEVFDHFIGLRPFNHLFSEFRTGRDAETYDIFSKEFGGPRLGHRFGHEIAVAQQEDIESIERFMDSTHPGTNKKWVRAAFSNGARCFVAKVGDDIAGIGWLSFVNRIGRLHSLFVRPQFRRFGMGRDLLYARLLWLESKHARSAYSEISRFNPASSSIASKAGMKIVGQVYEYTRNETLRPTESKGHKAV